MAYKQHFIEWFSGADISSIWTKTDITGTGSATMSDSVDGGFLLVSDTGAGVRHTILSFNNKRQYDFENAVIIGVCQRLVATNTGLLFGLSGDLTNGGADYSYCGNDSRSTYYDLQSRDASTASSTASDIPVDTTKRAIKLELSPTNMVLTVDGVLKVTKTTNRPTVKLQPRLWSLTANGGASASSNRFNYVEAYNT